MPAASGNMACIPAPACGALGKSGPGLADPEIRVISSGWIEMSEQPKNRPASRDVRTSLVDNGWSDVPPEVDDESTVQVSRDELDRMVESHTSERAAPRELPRYEALAEEGNSDSERLRQDDATKRIAYAALLGGSQAGKGGPRAAAAYVHEQPTLVGQPRLSEEAARQLAVPEPEAGAPLPSFADEQDSASANEAFEHAAESFEPEFAFVPGVEPPEQEMLPRHAPELPQSLGFDDSDLTVPALAGPLDVAAEPELPAPAASSASAFAAVSGQPGASQPPPAAMPPAAMPPVPMPPAAMPPTAMPLTAVPPTAMPPTAMPPAEQPGTVLHTPAEFGQTVASGAGTGSLPFETQARAPGLSAALGQRFHCAGLNLPVWLLWILPMGVACAALLAALRMASSGGVIGVSSDPALESPSQASAQPVAEMVLSLHERAVRGDAEALNSLLKVPEADRSVADEVAIVKARAARELGQLQELARRVERDHAVARSEETKQRLLQYVNDPRTAPDALAIISALPAPAGPDLLYEIWTGTKQSNDATQLAKELVYKRSVTARASEGLKVALELRAEPPCDVIPALLPRAAEFGDWRSLHLLGKLLVRRGCGPSRRQDCYPCLRTPAIEESIEAAIKAVRTRPRPKL
jgi:hypothetical protein